MKRIAISILFLALTTTMSAQIHSFRGTVTRMRMSECTWQPGFMSSMSGTQGQVTSPCPEYTVVTDKVVYVLVAKRAEQFIPLAEDIVFHIKKNEVVLLSDDEKKESKFVVREMTLRSEWERAETRRAIEAKLAERSANYEVRNPPRAVLVQTGSR
jgi:hypothetical protein